MKTKTRHEDGEKVVDGGEVEFGETSGQSQVQNAPADSKHVFHHWESVAMEKLGSHLGWTFDKLYTSANLEQISDFNRSRIQYALPYFVNFHKVPNRGLIKVMQSKDDDLYGPCLEASFGVDNLRGVGIEPYKVNQDNITQYCPEFLELQKLPLCGQITANPYQHIFMLPVQSRPFFTEVIETMIEEELIPAKDNSFLMPDFLKPVTLDCALLVAERVGAKSRLKDYMEMYSKIL